jgi:Na+/proline symporter
MAIKKYLDWKGWFEGLYLSWIKTLTSTVLTWVGTNAAGSMGVPNIAMNWQQGVSMLGVITFIEVVRYLNAKPKPETLTESIDTTTITKP